MLNRVKYFDIAKFIGLMMIILGHLGVPDINTFVYTFHIPLFFLISGYFYHPRENQKEFVKLKFKQLIYPYLFVMFSVIIINTLISLYNGINFYEILQKTRAYIIGFIYGSGFIDNILGYKIETVGPIWFCVALFWDYVILNFIINKKHKLLILTTLFVIGYISSQYIWLPFDIQVAMTSTLFVYIGHLAKQNNLMSINITFVNVFPLLCMWGLCLSYGGRFLFVSNTAVFVITDIISALCASYLVILYCKWLENNSKFANLMANLGKYTLVMLCFHSIDVDIMPWNSFYLTENTSSAIILLKLLLTLMKFIFPILGIYIVLKIKFLKNLFLIKN